jgi:transcriptional regulator GlxA family with amidase domain
MTEAAIHPLKRVAILAYPKCSGAQVLGLHDSMLLANRVASQILGTQAIFDVRVVGVAGRSVTAAGGVRVGLTRTFRDPDLVVVPGFALSEEKLDESLRALRKEIGFISDVFRRGIPVASVCVGAFLLGEAHMLEGRRATTAWMFAKELERRYPAAIVERDAVVVEDGGIVTTGGFSVAFDLAVHLIRRTGGDALATAFGKFAMLDVARTSQAPFVDELLLSRSNGAFSQAVRQWLTQRLADPYRLERLARAFATSPRTLLRRFQTETQESPLTYLHRARIDQAKQLLGTTTLNVSEITERVGYRNVSTFVRLFRRLVGQSPGRYRAVQTACLDTGAVAQLPAGG